MNTEVMPTAVRKCPASHHAFVTYVANVGDCLEGNVSYTDANPTAAEIKTLASEMALANAKAKNGGPTLVAERKAKRRDIEEKLDLLVGYVRAKVRANAPDALAAAAMILSAGLSIRKPRAKTKSPLTVKHGSVSGDVLISALAVAKTAVYFWEYSLDQQTWTSVPQTLTASTKVSGLASGRVYHFRFRAQTRKGLGDYSDIVKLMVL